MPNATIDLPEERDVKTEVGALCLVLAVVVAGYWLAAPTEPPRHWPAGTNVSAQAERTPRFDQPSVPPTAATAQGARAATPGDRDRPRGALRECAPEPGTTDACVR
jgi:hypothetical protein